MSRSEAFAVLCVLGLAASASDAQIYGFGKPATEREIAGWDIDVSPDGRGLPRGGGTAVQGKPLYEQHCAACHGPKGEGKPADVLVGGKGTLGTDKPVMTVGSYWPYATTIYDYINRAMPIVAPQSLKPDEVYAITAYLLFLNGIIAETQTMDASTLPKVEMPNRKGFVQDPRPDIVNVPCRDHCR